MSVFFCDELLSVSEKFCVSPKDSFSGSPPSKGDLEGLHYLNEIKYLQYFTPSMVNA